MALPITAGSDSLDSQTHTQSPQSSAGSGSPATAPTSSVQPGTATSLLTSTQGVKLNNTQLSVVNISTSPQTITGQTHTANPPKTHHINPVLLGIAGACLLLAVVFFVIISRSGKKDKY
ncbi:MAG TPA: hypothetical protein VHB72_02670 [Candidatus Saccharimonadales bacterium]|nr:hypothetical protein [Candidatus Saccharimonadales bacterium]